MNQSTKLTPLNFTDRNELNLGLPPKDIHGKEEGSKEEQQEL